MYGSNVSSAVVTIRKTNTLNASIFLCLLVTSHSQIRVSIIISRFWGAQGRFNSSSLGITVLHPLCPVFLKWHLLFSSRVGKTLHCYFIQSLCATLRKGHLLHLHSPLLCTSGWRDLHYLRLISAHFRWILYKVIQILQEWVKNEEKYMIVMNTEEAALSFYFPWRVPLRVEDFVQMVVNVRSSRISLHEYSTLHNYCLLVFMLTTENQHRITVTSRSELQERPTFRK